MMVARGNCRAVETVGKRYFGFSAVSTALGKPLAKKRSGFPTSSTGTTTGTYLAISSEGKRPPR